MKAEDINAEMDAMSDRLDHVGAGADMTKVRQLNAFISDWQDFYWGEYEQWPVNQLAVWENNLPNMQALLTSLEQSAGTVETPVTSEPAGPVVVIKEPTLVTATWPTWMKVAAGSVLALGIYKVARKLDIL